MHNVRPRLLLLYAIFFLFSFFFRVMPDVIASTCERPHGFFPKRRRRPAAIMPDVIASHTKHQLPHCRDSTAPSVSSFLFSSRSLTLGGKLLITERKFRMSHCSAKSVCTIEKKLRSLFVAVNSIGYMTNVVYLTVRITDPYRLRHPVSIAVP